jgi:hypothetical protein
MKRTDRRRLKLSRETVRTLENEGLRQVAGGVAFDSQHLEGRCSSYGDTCNDTLASQVNSCWVLCF